MISAYFRALTSRGFVALGVMALLNGFAVCVHAAGIFSTAYLGSGNFDSSVGLSTNKTYLDAVNLSGGTGTLSINNVVFTNASQTVTNPTGLNSSSGSWWLTGYANNYTGGGTDNVTGNLGTLLNTFNYGENPGSVNVSGLTVGQTYVLTFYSRSWDAAGNRVQNLTTSDGASTVYDVDMGASGQGYGNLLRYTFVATGGTETLNISPQVAANTMHTYGFTTEQTFNNTWSGSGNSNWSALANTASWSNGVVPSSPDTNASFPAQSAPTTITLDQAATLGYLQLAGSNSYTLSGTNALTLQADVGGTALINAVSGSHAINVPIVLNTSAAQLGSGTMTLNGAVSGTGGLGVGAGLLVVTASNNFTGVSTLSGGTLDLQNANAVQNSTIALSNGTAVFDASVGSNAFIFGGLAGSSNLVLNNNGVSPSAVALTVGGNNASTTYSGIVSGSGSLIKSGTGDLSLSGSSTFAGGTTTLSGRLIASAATANLGSGNVSVAPGAELYLLGPTLNNTVYLSGSGTNGTDTSPRGALRIDSGAIGAAGGVVLTGNAAIGSYNGGSGTIAAAITGPYNLTVNQATSSSPGTLYFTGSNSYTGTTTVGAGVLDVTTTAGLPYYSTPGSVSVASGATLAVPASAVSGWQQPTIDALRSNATFASGSYLGIDTTAGNFAYAMTTGPVSAVNKLGANTLTLSGTVGNLTVTSGGLTPASSTAIGTLNAANVNLAAGASLNYVLGSPGNSTLIQAAGLTLPSSGSAITVNLTDNGGANGQGTTGVNGTYPLISYSSLSGGNSTFNSTFAVGTKTSALSSGRTFSFLNMGSYTGDVALTVTSQNPVLYADSFTRTGNLNGSTPTIENGSTSTWSADGSWTTSTSQAVTTTAAKSAQLPFNPTVGNVYTFSSVLNPTGSGSAVTNWIGMGFSNAANTGGINTGSSLAWVLERYANTSGNYNQMFTGTAPSGPGNMPAAFPYSQATGPQTVEMVVDARSSLSSATVYWLVNGQTAASSTISLSATDYAMLGDGSASGTVGNMFLDSGSVWLGAPGLTGSAASWSNGTTANSTTAAVAYAGWSAGAIPNAAGATATFATSTGTANSTITLDGNRTLGQLTFANGLGNGNYALAQGSSGALILNNSGTGAAVTNYMGSNTITAPVTFADNVQAMVSTGSTLNIAGGISDTGSHSLAVNPTGAGGVLVLSASDGYSGTTALYGGVLNLANANALPTGGTINFAGGRLQYTSASAGQDYSGSIVNSLGPIAVDTNGQNVTWNNSLAASNVGGLFHTGAGTLTLTNSNAYSGTTVFSNSGSGYTVLANANGGATIPGNVQIGDGSAGTVYLQTGDAYQFSNTAMVSFNGSSGNYPTLELLGQNQRVGTISDLTGNGIIENTQLETAGFNSPTLFIANPTNTTFSGYLRNSAGTNTATVGLNLSGTGGLTLSGANITYTGATAIGSGGTLTLLNTTGFKSGGITDNGTLVFAPVSSSIDNGSPGFTGTISGTGSLAVNNGGTNSLGLGGTNSYSGGTFVNQGRIYAYSASAAGVGTVTVSGSSSYSFWFTGTNTITNNFVLSTIGMGAGNNDAIFGDGGANGGSYTISGSITLSSAASIGAYSSNPLTVTGPITGPGELFIKALRTDTVGTVTLSNSNDNYAGGTFVNFGTLKQGAANVIPSGTGVGDLTVSSSLAATFDLGGYNSSINGLWGSALGIVTDSSSAATLTEGNNNVTSTFSGVISGALNLLKTGTGNLTLAGADTFIGFAQTNAGTLTLANSGAAGAATLTYSPNVVFASGIGNFTLGNLSGGTNLNLVDAAGHAINLTVGGGANTTSATYSGVLSGSGNFTKGGNNSLTLGTANAYSAASPLTLAGGTLNLGGFVQSTSSSVTFQGGTVSNGTLSQTGNNNFAAQSGAASAVLAGNVALNKTTSGLFTLTNPNNSYSGGTTINSGTLDFAAAALTSGTVAFTNNATLQWAVGNTQDISSQLQPIPANVTAGFDAQGNVVTLAAAPLTGAGGINRVGTGTLVLANSNNSYGGGTTLSGGTLSISSLADLGSGSLTFNGGVLEVTGNALTSMDTFTYNPSSFNGGFDVPAGNTFTVNQDLAGAGGVIKSDGGTLVLDGTNTYTGGTSITGGVALFSSSSAIGSPPGMVVVSSGAAAAAGYPIDQNFVSRIAPSSAGAVALGAPSSNNLDFSITGSSLSSASLGAVGNQTYSGILTPYGGAFGSYKLGGGGGTLTFPQAISGSSTLTIVGPGTVALTASNSYTGATTISSGVAQLANQQGIPDGTVLSLTGGSLDLDGNNKILAQTSNLAAGGTITDSTSAVGVVSITATGSSYVTINSLITGPVGFSVTSTGGTGGDNFDFTNPANTFSGGVTISNASARMYNTNGNANTAMGTGTITVSNSGFLMIWTNTGSYAGSVTVSNNFVLNTLGGAQVASQAPQQKDAIYADGASGGAPLTILTGQITLNTAAAIGGNSANNLLIAGQITGVGGLVKGLGRSDDTDILTLANTNNNYQGGTTINQGTLKQGASGVLPYGAGYGDTTLGSGALFDLGGYDAPLNGLWGSGTVINSATSGNNLLTVGNNNATSTFAGAIQNPSGSTISLAKTGSGSLTLAGANTYSGTTAINGGVLTLANSAALPSSGPITFGGGTLQITASNTQDYSARFVNSTGPIAINTNGLTATVGASLASSNSGGLTKSGAGVLVVANANAYSGPTTISGGTLQMANNTLPALQNGNLDSPAISSNNYQYYGASGTNPMTSTQQAQFIWASSGNGGKAGALMNNSTAWGYTMPYPGSNSQAFSLQEDSTLTQSLYFPAGTYTVTWSEATRSGQNNPYYFQVNGANVGSVYSTTNTNWTSVNDTFTIAVAGTNSIGFSGTVTSSDQSVALDNIGLSGTPLAGQLPALTPFNITAAGAAWDLNGGTQTVGSLAGVAGSIVANVGQLTVGGNNANATFAGTIAGGGGLIKVGTGIQALASANTYAGGTIVQAGVLQLGNTAALGPGGLAANGGTLDLFGNGITVPSFSGAAGVVTNTASGTLAILSVGQSGATNFGGQFNDGAGSLGVSLVGAGTLTLTNTNAYSGDTNVASGTLRMGTINALPFGANAGNVTVAGLLDLNGNSTRINGLRGSGTVDNTSGGPATLGIGNNNAASTFSGVLQNSGSVVGGSLALTKTGSGSFTLAGANTYAGATTVNAGVLSAGAGNALSPNSAITVNGGTLDASSGAQSFPSLTMGSAGALNLSAGNTINNGSGFDTFGGTLNVLNFTGGTEDLINYGSYSGAKFSLVTGITGSYGLSYGTSQLDIVALATGPATWQFANSGSWTNPGNWNTNTVPSGVGVPAIVGAATSVPWTITLDSPQTLGSLTFTNTANSAAGYTLATGVSGSLTLDNSGSAVQVVVNGGSHAITAPVYLVGGDLQVSASNDSVLTIGGNIGQDATRNLTLNGDGTGELILSGTNTLGGPGAVALVSSGTLVLNDPQALADGTSLTVGDASAFGGIQPAGGAETQSAVGGPIAAVSIAPVPEPGTLAIVAAIIACGALFRRSRRKQAPPRRD